jgi:hypothetical protein
MLEGLVVAGVLAMRFFVPLLILRYPLPGIVASMLADAVDGALFDNFTGLSLENYQHYDKSLDIYYLAIAYVACLRNWTNTTALRVARVLWYFRLAGVALFAVTDARIVLFLFPAIFEYFFIFYEAYALRWDPDRLNARHLAAATVTSWALKLPQEYWLHVAEGSTTEWLTVSVFGMDRDSSRFEVLAQNLWLIPAAALFLLAIAASLWFLLRLAPPADRALSFDANRSGPGGFVLLGKPRTLEPVFTRVLAEKAALVGLVAIVFASFLPGVEARPAELFAALTVVVTINAGIASWQGRRGIEWRAALPEFLTMLAANAAMILCISFIARWSDGTLSGGSALFYSLLLSLLITLFDRYRYLRFWWVLSRHVGDSYSDDVEQLRLTPVEDIQSG